MSDYSRFEDPLTLGLMNAAGGFLDPQGGMMAGMQGFTGGMMQGRQMQYQGALAKQQQEKLMRELMSRQQLSELAQKHVQQNGGQMDVRKFSNELMSIGNPDLITQAQSLLKNAPKVKSTVKGYDQSGSPVFHNVMDTGEVSATDVRPAERMSFQNTGQETLGIDPFTGQKRLAIQNTMAPGEQARLAQGDRQFGASHGLAQANYGLAQRNADLNQQRMMLEMNPEFQAQKAGMIAGAKAQSTNEVQAKKDLPNVIQQGETTIQLIDDLLAHPGFGVSVGKTAPLGTVQSFIPGTQAASFDIALKQIKGKQFLEAFETLKGGGQITQIEGEKATQAMSRMEKSNTEEEFVRAAKEFQGIIKNGINRAKMRAGNQATPQSPQPQMSNDGWGELR